MPYEKLTDLPASVRNHLPRHGQEIYLKAFNNAWQQYAEASERRRGRSREETAHRVAWSAVEKVYAKGDDGKWHKRSA